MKEIEKIINEPVSDLLLQDSGWYIVVRTQQPESKRYNVGFKKSLSGFDALLFDFKTNEKHKFSCSNIKVKTIKNKVPVKAELIHKYTAYEYKNAVHGDNGYFKNKEMLEIFNRNNQFIKVNKNNNLIIPYTTFDLYPAPVGAKIIKPDGSKLELKGGKLKGAFHPHRFNKELSQYIIGEGTAECILAKEFINDANVLEVGAAYNIDLVLSQIPKNSIIYLMGDHGSEGLHAKLKAKYPTIKITYTPDKKYKDFADYFKVLKDKSNIQQLILGQSLDQKVSEYKALGVEDTNVVIYSKLLNKIVIISPGNVDELLRICMPGSEELKISDKRIICNSIFYEAAKLGSYDSNNVKPIGLWKNKKNKAYYNDGHNVYEIKEEKIVKKHYEDVLSNEFLLCKINGSGKLNTYSEFNHIKQLEQLFAACDWIQPEISSKLLLGFLAQGIFSGVSTFRPHIWLQSEQSHAGKSWISSYIAKNLISICGKRESGESTTKGTGQLMQNLAGHLFCDEIGEKDSAHAKDNKMMIELLRSAATAENKITVGTPEQVAKQRLVRFSALLACIEGTELLKKQDYDRIIFLRLKHNPNSVFMSKYYDKFKEFENKRLGEGFMAHILKGYYLYENAYINYYKKLNNEFPDIGHKARGLAACIAGYLVYTRSEEDAKFLYKKIKNSSFVESYDEFDPNNDIVNELLSTIIPGKLLGSYVSDQSVMDYLTEDGDEGLIHNLGIKIKDGNLILYRNMFDNFINKFSNNTKFGYYNILKSSKFYVKESNSRFSSRATRCLIFDIGELLYTNSDQNKKKQ